MSYLKNCWYLAGWAAELPKDGMLARRLLDIPVVLFRDQAGEAKAVFDRCPHRFAPLSMGKVSEGSLLCGYHGLAFAGDGTCTANPHGPIVPALKVQAFPVREAFKGLWIWFGDVALAASHPVPELKFLEDAPDTAFSSGYLRGNGNYQLYIDNILDLSHADYLHQNTLGGGSITRTKAEIYQNGDSISIHWHPMNEIPSPAAFRALRLINSDQRVDSWTEITWSPPATMVLRAGAVLAGTPRELGGNVQNVHIMTPETADSTHYFFASTRDFAVDDEVTNQRMAKMRSNIFTTEDGPMIAAQSERMEGAEFWALKPVLLPIDQGGVRVRRIMEKMIAAEQEPRR